MNELVYHFISITGVGLVVGGSMGGIVIITDYVVTSLLQMLKGR